MVQNEAKESFLLLKKRFKVFLSFAPLSSAQLDWMIKVFLAKLSGIHKKRKTQPKIPELFSIFSIQIKSTANRERKVVLIVKSNRSEIPSPPYL